MELIFGWVVCIAEQSAFRRCGQLPLSLFSLSLSALPAIANLKMGVVVIIDFDAASP